MNYKNKVDLLNNNNNNTNNNNNNYNYIRNKKTQNYSKLITYLILKFNGIINQKMKMNSWILMKILQIKLLNLNNINII